MQPSVAIICAGGPAPGINTVISTVAKVFLKENFRVLGVQYGYEGLFSAEADIKEFDFAHADRIFSRGGSTLIMSRFKPKDADFTTNFFEKHNVKLLVTIGGDDTASTANRLTKFLKSKGLDIANIHVPKTIDNDLPLPGRNPTFGFPVYLSDHEDENGKVIPRLVNMNAEIARLFFHGLDFITERDYSAAAAYLKHPYEYDFYQILNWQNN